MLDVYQAIRPTGGAMRPIVKTVVSLSMWLLFLKGLLMIPITFYAFIEAYMHGEPTPLSGVIACATGTFAFISACLAAWIRKMLEA